MYRCLSLREIERAALFGQSPAGKTCNRIVHSAHKIMSLNLDSPDKTGVVAVSSHAETEFNTAQNQQRNENHRKQTHRPQTAS